ncbi:ferredoxin [Streptomyces sp. TRM 70361]|uniref:ferredoxin n=1 Tax=Streptomyces sp. TRM 70361 TaxID=3116553 RepID=UPI002E7B56BF|nr:ferredoxin [Streptomyces sp. TRM 70361]MEE1938168.1 ferredoxin [Streptomyces sp. TRM 70361]
MTQRATVSVRVDPERCCCSGMCVLTAPEVFDQSEEDGSVRLRRPEPPEHLLPAVRQAADLCPSRAIAIVTPGP